MSLRRFVGKRSRDIFVSVLDCDIIVSIFKLQSDYNIYLRANHTLG